jgi:hypothetical protein
MTWTLVLMSDEENQTVAVPAPSQVIIEEHPATASRNENMNSRQARDNSVLWAFRHLQSWVQKRIERSAPENSTRQVGDYTSRTFLNLPSPMPICDLSIQNKRIAIIILHGLRYIRNAIISAVALTFI